MSALRTVTDRTVKRSTSNLLPYAPPWVMAVLLLPAAVATSSLWGTNPWAISGLTLTSAALTAVAWTEGKKRSKTARWYATVSSAASGGWLTAATITGPFGRPTIDVLVFGGVALAGAWNIRKIMNGSSNSDRGSGGDLFEKVKLAGTQVRRASVDGPRVKAQLQLERGEQTVADVQSASTRIASALGVPSTGVRVQADPDRADRAELTIVPRDMLRDTIPWPGPSRPGGSITEPLELGLYEDGSTAKVTLPEMHMLIAGMTGAGKSEGALVLCAEVLSRRDVELWYCDPIKGMQTVAPIAHGVTRLVGDTRDGAQRMREAQQLISDLKTLIPERTQFLGDAGFKKWEPGCGLKYMVVMLEEAAAYISDSDELSRIAQQSRSCGVSLIVSLQRPTYTNMPIDVRQQLTGVLCFGLGKGDSQYALSETTLDAGADPEAWKAAKKGYAYLECPTVDESQWVTPMRCYLADVEDLKATVPAVGRELIPAGAVKIPSLGEDFEVPDTFTDELVSIPGNPEPGFMDDIDTSLEIADDDGPILILSRPAKDDPATTTAARAYLRDYLDKLAAAGEDTVRPSQLVDVRRQIDRSPQWLSGELKRLVAEGVLEELPERGLYGLRSAQVLNGHTM